MKKLFILLVLILAIFSLHLSAGFSTDIGVVSRYIWRGWDLLSDNNPAIQPSFTYAFGDSGFSAIIWCSFALGDREVYKYDDEIDLTLDYTFSPSEDISISLGMNSYNYVFSKNFSFSKNTTQEFYAAFGFTKLMFTPTLTIFYDTNLADGLYIQLAGGHSVKMSDTITIDFSAQMGYNSKYGIDSSGLSDLVLGAAIPIKSGKVSISPFVNMAFIFMDEVNKNSTEFWFGANISF